MLSNQSLSILKPLQKGTVIGFVDENIPTKLLEMGIVPGVSVCLKRQAPCNGPLFVEYGREKSNVVLRVDEANSILIEIE